MSTLFLKKLGSERVVAICGCRYRIHDIQHCSQWLQSWYLCLCLVIVFSNLIFDIEFFSQDNLRKACFTNFIGKQNETIINYNQNCSHRIANNEHQSSKKQSNFSISYRIAMQRWRVVLDEAHMIRSRNTLSARAVFELSVSLDLIWLIVMWWLIKMCCRLSIGGVWLALRFKYRSVTLIF